MAKLGMPYQELVAKVERALNPGAEITVNPWVESPDGRRDCDVSIRGSIDGQPIFVFIECKDWRRRVGVASIDALDSKRNDVGATDTIIYSNSGFSDVALKKAHRKGIITCSAIAEGDERIHVAMTTYVTTKRTHVAQLKLKLFLGAEYEITEQFEPSAISIQGGPLLNWARTEIIRVCRLVNQEQPLIDYREIQARYLWDSPMDASIAGASVAIRGVEIFALISSTWLGRQVQSTATLGRFDHETGKLFIPSGEAMLLGPLDIHDGKWKVLYGPPEEDEAGPLRFYAYSTVQEVDGGTPDLTPAIAQCEASLIRSSGETDLLHFLPDE
jgi:Restriction endonuclease